MAQFYAAIPLNPALKARGALTTGLFILATAILSPGSAFAQTAGEPAKANAVFQQAKAFHDGTDQARDLDMARTLYRRAADMGSNFACINLGYMYFTGEGVPKNYGVSRKWYEAAANNGNSDAQRMMSVFYKNGLGVAANQETAELWSGRAAQGWTKPLAAPVEPAKTMPPTAEIKAKPEIIRQAAQKTAVPDVIETAEAKRKQAADKAAAQAALAARKQEQAKAAKEKAAQAAAKAAAVKSKPQSSMARPAVKAASLPNEPAGKAAPFWLGLISALALALFGGLAILSAKFQAVKAVRDNQQFVRAFYARHRAILKNSYAKAQEHKGVIVCDRDDPWVKASLNLMIRFAKKHEIVTGIPMKLTSDVIRSLQKDLRGAEDILLPLVPAVEDLLIADLGGNFSDKIDKPKMPCLIKDMMQSKPANLNSARMSPAQ